MKKTLMFLVAVTLFTVPALSTGFYSVHSPNGIDVWAVGNSGVVFHSFDGGITWTTFTRGSATLRSVYTLASNVWIVGDSGVCHVSTDGGNTWNTQVVGGGAALRSVTFFDAQTGWVAGNNGSILKTSDGGSSWTPQSSGPGPDLYAIAFVDSQVGFSAGTGGTLLKTTDGGTTWTNIAPIGWSKDILSLSVSGSAVYVSGVDEFCYRSTDGGTTWTQLNFRTDTRSDVNAVFAVSAESAYFVGGGGFIRTTTDRGATYNFGTHQMHAKLNSVFFYAATNGWACGEKNNAVLRTTDAGATWQLPQGTTVSYQWQQKFSAGSIGNTFCVNPVNKNIIYVVMGSTIYISGDRGDNWISTGRSITGGGSTWSFFVSPMDTNIWVAATSGGGKGVRRSTNRGVTWTTTLVRNFTTYGMPLEMDPDHPDTLIFAEEKPSTSDAVLYISANFGATWDTLARTSFRSPCDIVIVPGNTSLWYVGDGVTSSGQAQMWRSTNYGKTWTSIYTSPSSEIPMIASSRLRNNYAVATAWGGTSYMKTTNSGLSWSSLPSAPTGSTWGTDVAKDDPNVVVYATYGGSTSFLSTNAGTSFNPVVTLSGSNSGMLAYDRATFIAHQAGNGVWKYNITYTVPVTNLQTLTVVQPSAGAVWQYNTLHNITWNSGNISNLRIDYKTSPASAWQTIVASTPASPGSYSWRIPNAPTAQARVRISDASDSAPVDSSGLFSITASAISLTPSTIDFGAAAVGSSLWDTVRICNAGTATLVISSVTSDSAFFAPGRTSFSIPPGGCDTLSITFAPSAAQLYRDTLRIANNSPDSVQTVFLSGSGYSPAALTVIVPNGGEVWEYSQIHNITWSSTSVSLLKLEYRTHDSATWNMIADSVVADSGRYAWIIPNDPTSQARVKITDLAAGSLVDSSDNVFSIVAANLVVMPNSLDFGNVPTNQRLADTVRIENTGTADLVISQIVSDSLGFVPSRGSMVLSPGTSDTLTVLFAPMEVRSYTAHLRLTNNSAASPVVVSLTGVGTNPVGVRREDQLPATYYLTQNYPNPFNPSTVIAFGLPKDSYLTLKVYNALGQEVAVLVNSYVPAGRHQVQFDASGLPSGLYFYRVNAGEFVETRRMMLVK